MTKEQNHISQDLERPLFTFLLMTYNQEQFIREAVISAFEQTYSPLEILLTDDCSTDRTFEIMSEMAAAYEGPHKIILNQNPENIGIVPHLNLAVSLSSGEMIIGAAGDDISSKYRTSRIFEEWRRLGSGICSIFSDAIIIDENGHQTGSMCQGHQPKYATTAEEAVIKGFVGVAGCSHAYSRKAFEIFGPIEHSVNAEDMVIPFRNLLLGNIGYIDEQLVLYRSHGGNVSIGPSGKPTREKRLKDNKNQEAALLSWLRDVQTMPATGIIPFDRYEKLFECIFTQLHYCSIEKRTYHQNKWQAVRLIVQEVFGFNRVNAMVKILERRWRCTPEQISKV